MDWYKNLKIGQKIIGLVALVTFFICAVGLVGYHYSNVLAKNTEDVYQNNLLPIKYVNEMRIILNANNSNVLRLIIEDDRGTIERIKQDINQRASAFNIVTKKYEKTALTPQTKEILAEFQVNVANYRVIRDQIIEAALANRSNEANMLYKSGEPLFNNLVQSLKTLADINVKLADEAAQKGKKDASSGTLIIVLTGIAAVGLSLWFGISLAKMMAFRLGIVANWLKEVADGNLAVNDIIIRANDEIGDIGTGANKTAESLREVIKSVVKSVEEISAASEELTAAADQTAQGAQHVSSSATQLAAGAGQVSSNISQLSEGTQQVASSITQLAAGIQEISRSLEHGTNNISSINKAIQNVSNESVVVAKLGNETESNANTGKEHVKKAVNKIDSIRVVSTEISDTINELGKLSSEIETIVDLIKSIAGQTNLLALNAAIEAARAGEHGKGFAVVADEVKKLAGQSGEATDKITSMIKEIQNKTHLAVSSMDKGINEVQEGVVVVNEAGNALENIIEEVKQANSKIQGISKEIDGIAKGSEELVNMVQDISSITEETAASAEEIASITEQTASGAQEITGAIQESAANTEEIASITQQQTASLEEINASSLTLAKIAENLQKQVAIFKF